MIKASVGRGGQNQKSDVSHVQSLLNNYITANKPGLAALKVDGICGAKSISAIENFQGRVVGMAKPDGRVDVGGRTIKHLENYSKSQPQVVPATTVPVVVPAAAGGSATVKSGVTPNTDPRQLKTRAAIAAAYGAISEDKKWARQGEFLGSYTVPSNITSDTAYNWVNAYDPKKRKVSTVWCHKAMHAVLDKALANLKSRELLSELKEYGGCHSIRATRGTTNWSAHSWALAIDINMTGNGLGETPKMSAEFAKCFTDAGFGWGGNYRRKDGMNFTIAGFDMPSQ